MCSSRARDSPVRCSAGFGVFKQLLRPLLRTFLLLPGGGDRFTAALLSRLAPIAIEEHILGHRTAVTAARFFPTPLQLTPLQPTALPGAGSAGEERHGTKRPRAAASEAAEQDPAAPHAAAAAAQQQGPQLATALALASADGRLTVWSSARRDVPCLELRRAFGGPVTDLAWGAAMLPRADQRGDAAAAEASGCVGAAPFLLASSIDGSIAVVLFGRPSTSAPAAGERAEPRAGDEAEGVEGVVAAAAAAAHPGAAAPPTIVSALGLVPAADVVFAGA